MRRTDDHNDNDQDEERLDKWLWAARFYKTRNLAAQAVDSGRIEVNGERVKRSRGVSKGDRVTLRRGPYVTTVVVTALDMRRGPASKAAGMFDETPESKTARETVRVQLSSLPMREAGQGRPTKKERRQLRQLRDGRD